MRAVQNGALRRPLPAARTSPPRPSSADTPPGAIWGGELEHHRKSTETALSDAKLTHPINCPPDERVICAGLSTIGPSPTLGFGDDDDVRLVNRFEHP